MPTAMHSATSSGIETITASARKASICSVTFIVPISADIAAPTRPATIRAVNTGASSRQSETETTAPTAEPIPSLLNWKNVCAENTAPVNAPVIMTTSWESNPTSTTWLRNNFHRSLWVKIERNVSAASRTSSPRYWVNARSGAPRALKKRTIMEEATTDNWTVNG